MKTKEELNVLRSEVETLSKKLADLTEEELAQVVGGRNMPIPLSGGYSENERNLIHENTETVLRGSHEIAETLISKKQPAEKIFRRVKLFQKLSYAVFVFTVFPFRLCVSLK